MCRRRPRRPPALLLQSGCTDSTGAPVAAHLDCVFLAAECNQTLQAHETGLTGVTSGARCCARYTLRGQNRCLPLLPPHACPVALLRCLAPTQASPSGTSPSSSVASWDSRLRACATATWSAPKACSQTPASSARRWPRPASASAPPSAAASSFSKMVSGWEAHAAAVHSWAAALPNAACSRLCSVAAHLIPPPPRSRRHRRLLGASGAAQDHGPQPRECVHQRHCIHAAGFGGAVVGGAHPGLEALQSCHRPVCPALALLALLNPARSIASPPPQDTFWLRTNEGTVLLPTADEIAAMGGEAGMQDSAARPWRGCVWGVHALMEGEVVQVIDGVASAEACCRLCHAHEKQAAGGALEAGPGGCNGEGCVALAAGWERRLCCCPARRRSRAYTHSLHAPSLPPQSGTIVATIPPAMGPACMRTLISTRSRWHSTSLSVRCAGDAALALSSAAPAWRRGCLGAPPTSSVPPRAACPLLWPCRPAAAPRAGGARDRLTACVAGQGPGRAVHGGRAHRTGRQQQVLPAAGRERRPFLLLPCGG